MAWSKGEASLKIPVTPPGIDPGTVGLVAQHINHYANPGRLKQERTLSIELWVQKCVLSPKLMSANYERRTTNYDYTSRIDQSLP
jgi:hypothetical protein